MPPPTPGRCAGAVHRSWARPGAAFTSYLSLLSAPITPSAVVVFLGSWLQASFGLPNAWWLVISLAAVLVTSVFVLPGVTASARTAVVLFAAEAGGLVLICGVVLARSGDALAAPLHATGGTPGGWSGLLGITFATAVSGFAGGENSRPPGTRAGGSIAATGMRWSTDAHRAAV